MLADIAAPLTSASDGAAAQMATAPTAVVQLGSTRRPIVIGAEKGSPGAAHGGAAHVVIRCVVTSRGLVDKCELLSESPAGQGFGAAAIRLSREIKLRPVTTAGQTVRGAQITIPITFTRPKRAEVSPPLAPVEADSPPLSQPHTPATAPSR
jgi:TonB family protein